MIYVILNIGIALYLTWASFNVNTKNMRNENSLINIVLLSAASAILMVVTMLMVLWGPERFTIFLEHVILFLVGLIYTVIAFYYLSNAVKRNKFMTFLEAFFILLALYISASKIDVVDYTRFDFSASLLFGGELANFFPFTWIHLYIALFIFFLPGMSVLILTLCAENAKSRQAFQRSILFAATLVFAWISSGAILYISQMLPMMISLYTGVLAILVTFMTRVSVQDKIYDSLTLFSGLLVNVMKYALPSAFAALFYVGLRPFYATSKAVYTVVVFAIALLAIFAGRLVAAAFTKLSTFRSASYGAAFEADLAAIDYNDETSDICNKLFEIFQNRANVGSMKVLIAGGNHELNTVFASGGPKPTLNTHDPGLDAIREQGINIFMKNEADGIFALEQKSAEINALFKTIGAEVLIILNEGRHLVGVIALGEKRGGASYDDYDKQVFDKLYSYFFVFGYYMSNIANASVVGTVNREIRMSAQIITSIQENMDPVENPKMDVGYLMVPAHNIGGEFVDLIRLTDTRHIFVTGALSGKGISASMSMVILKSIIRTYLNSTHDFKKLVAKVNQFIRFSLPKGTFFAGIFCLMDFETDTLYYINCGIPTMLLYTRAYNNVIEIQGNGYVLGFVKDISPLLKVKQIKMNAGDVIAITTAGLINSHSLRGEQYGKDRIKKSMTDNYMYSGMRMCSFLFDDLKRFMAKELDDDITVMMIRYLDKDSQTVSDESSELEASGAGTVS
ncbi:MAG: serine/threonine-protein phosphatase [Treponema sp.]|nr:serine/threonine-protein phosphatase [Treponema sp.]